MLSIYNNEYVDIMKQPMFFGEPLNIARDDIQKYPIFMKNFKQQVGYYWVPEEIKLDSDKRTWKELTASQQKVFEKNIAYQILLDSVQCRSISSVLMPIASLPELEMCLSAWGYMECVHSRSYQYLLKTVLNSPTPVFDSVINDPMIKNRAAKIVKKYNDFAQLSEIWRVLGYGCHTVNGVTYNVTEYNLKQSFYAYLINVYFLESILFYVSFICSWSFSENNLMVGNGKIVSFIARDENLHTGISKNIITNYQRYEHDDVMLRVMEDSDALVWEMLGDFISQDEYWIGYLFEDNPQLLGVNEEIMMSSLYHIANKRMSAIGKGTPFPDYKRNPVKWADKYLNLDGTQSALQEVEGTNYEAANVNTSGFDAKKVSLILR